MAINVDAAQAQVANMLARIAELEGVNADLNHRGLAVQGQLNVAQEQLVVARARPAHVSKPRIPDPSIFTGKTGAFVEEWLSQVQKQFDFHSEYFTTDAARIKYALSFVLSPVVAWYKSCESVEPIDTWAAFVAALLERYQPISASITARTNLDRLVQTGSVTGYSAMFQSNLNSIKDMSSADQVHQFIRGLKQVLKFEVVKQHPTNIHDAINIAITAEAHIVPMSGNSASSGFTHRPSRSGYSGSGGASGAPMDLNVIGAEPNLEEHVPDRPQQSAGSPSTAELLSIVRDLQSRVQSQHSLNAMFGGQDRRRHGGSSASSSSGPKVPGISRDDYERCRREGVCIKCKQTGHIAANCVNPARLNW